MNEVIMHPVTSSQIKSVGYDPARQTLYIEFTKGSVYSYSNVSQEKFNAIMSPSMSVGKYFGDLIKGVHPYEKLPVYVKEGKLVQI